MHGTIVGAISAVFQSWMGKRAISYGVLRIFPMNGNCGKCPVDGIRQYGDTSATGVAFTRNPPPAKTIFMENGWLMRREKTWLPASGPRIHQ